MAPSAAAACGHHARQTQGWAATDHHIQLGIQSLGAYPAAICKEMARCQPHGTSHLRHRLCPRKIHMEASSTTRRSSGKTRGIGYIPI